MPTVTVCVIYYRPDYTSLLNEFIWQTEDVVPDMPRTSRFLRHFTTLCVVQNFIISVGGRRIVRPVDHLLSL